jgi:hypothetical protein
MKRPVYLVGPDEAAWWPIYRLQESRTFRWIDVTNSIKKSPTAEATRIAQGTRRI